MIISLLAWAAVALQPTPPGCTSPESRQFDFWLGEWEVRPNGQDKIIARSTIEKKYGGCAVRENWMPLNQDAEAGGGGSLNHYDPQYRQWRQVWLDSSGTRVDFAGGMVGDKMVLKGRWANFGGPGKDAIVKMEYEAMACGAVRQHGLASSDGEKSWQTAFDLIYSNENSECARPK